MFTGIGKNVWLGFYGTYSLIFFPWTIQMDCSWVFSIFFPLLYGGWEQSEQRENTPLSMEFKTWWSWRVNSCQHWHMIISAGPRSSPLDSLLSLLVRREHSCEEGKHVSHGWMAAGPAVLPSSSQARPSSRQNIQSLILGGQKLSDAMLCQFLRWNTPFFHWSCHQGMFSWQWTAWLTTLLLIF